MEQSASVLEVRGWRAAVPRGNSVALKMHGGSVLQDLCSSIKEKEKESSMFCTTLTIITLVKKKLALLKSPSCLGLINV